MTTQSTNKHVPTQAETGDISLRQSLWLDV